MKNTTYQCDICRIQLPIMELIPLHFEKSAELKRDILAMQTVNIYEANKHICYNCLHDFGEIAKVYGGIKP